MIHPDGSCPAIHPHSQGVGVFRLPVSFILQLLLSYPKLKLCIFCFKSTINQYPEYLYSQVDQDFDGSYSDIPQSDLDDEPSSSEIEDVPFSFDSPSVTPHASPPSTPVLSPSQLRPPPTTGLQAALGPKVYIMNHNYHHGILSQTLPLSPFRGCAQKPVMTTAITHRHCPLSIHPL